MRLEAFDGDTLLWTMNPAEVTSVSAAEDVWVVSGTQEHYAAPAPEPPAPIFFPGFSGRTIELGMTGGDVQTWQDRVRHLGWDVPATGIFDALSEHITKMLQTQVGLDPSGKVDEQTWLAAFHPQPLGS